MLKILKRFSKFMKYDKTYQRQGVYMRNIYRLSSTLFYNRQNDEAQKNDKYHCQKYQNMCDVTMKMYGQYILPIFFLFNSVYKPIKFHFENCIIDQRTRNPIPLQILSTRFYSKPFHQFSSHFLITRPCFHQVVDFQLIHHKSLRQRGHDLFSVVR